jgi:hypothetical protein
MLHQLQSIQHLCLPRTHAEYVLGKSTVWDKSAAAGCCLAAPQTSTSLCCQGGWVLSAREGPRSRVYICSHNGDETALAAMQQDKC